MNRKHLSKKVGYRCLILLLATSLSIAAPKAKASSMSALVGSPTYLGQSLSINWLETLRDYYFIPTFIATLLILFGIPNFPGLISRIYDWDIQNFRKNYLRNSFRDFNKQSFEDLKKNKSQAFLDSLSELRDEFKARLEEILMEKVESNNTFKSNSTKSRLFEDCLKECFRDFKNVPSPEDSHLLILFTQSVKDALGSEIQNQFLDEIFDTLGRDSRYKNKFLDHFDKYFKDYASFSGQVQGQVISKLQDEVRNLENNFKKYIDYRVGIQGDVISKFQDEVISGLQDEVRNLRGEIKVLKSKIDQFKGDN